MRTGNRFGVNAALKILVQLGPARQNPSNLANPWRLVNLFFSNTTCIPFYGDTLIFSAMEDAKDQSSNSTAEKAGAEIFENATLTDGRELTPDKNGICLVPQPGRFKDDPLNWPSWLKRTVLLQVSFMAMMGPFNCAVINPSIVLLSKAFRVISVKGAYNSTTAIILGGVFAFVWKPLTSVYGRWPIAIFCLLLACLASIGSLSQLLFLLC